MPLKGSGRKQAKEEVKTPQTKVDAKSTPTPRKATAKQTPKKEVKDEPKAITPKKQKVVAKFTSLARDLTATLPIDVTFQGDIKQIKSTYTHILKLEAGAPFTLVDTYVVPEGQQYEGHQLILLKPAQAFKFMKLPPVIRNRVYKFLFFTKGQGSQPIVIDGKRKDETKDPYAKSFAEGSKMRVAILRVNKEINQEATPVLYARPIRFDTPAILLNFMANIDAIHRAALRHIELRQYVKKDAKTALVFLSEAKGLEHLRLEVDVVKEDDVHKAAAAFWLDAGKLLDAVGQRIEKSMVSPRKVRVLEEVNVEVEESGESQESEEEEEDEEEEEEEEDKAGYNETEKTTEPDHAEAKAEDTTSKDDIVMSNDQTDTPEVKTVGTKTIGPRPTDIATGGMFIVEGTKNLRQKDSKSPAPVSPTKKKATESEQPQLIRGQKVFALGILNFGKQAFKNRDGSLWTAAKKQDFLNILEGKLK